MSDGIWLVGFFVNGDNMLVSHVDVVLSLCTWIVLDECITRVRYVPILTSIRYSVREKSGPVPFNSDGIV